MRAYIFINAKAGKTKTVTKALKALQGVTAADPCWGSPDIIIAVKVKNERTLNELVLSKIQQVSGVEHTETHIILE
jgi:DNA-binding Lrp family transcriptional regulator